MVREPKFQSTHDTKKKPIRITQIQRKRNSPTQKDNLVPLPSTLLLKLEIIDGPSTLSLWEISHKVIIVLDTRRLIDHDLGKVFVQGEDDVLVLLLQLEILECVDALRVDADSGCLLTDVEGNDNEICVHRRRTIVNVVVVGGERDYK